MKTLERQLGLPAVVSISIGAMLGSGLFVLPGLAAALTGPSVWLAYLVAGVLVLPAALSKAELATAMPTSGGTYVYIDRAFGPLAGTVAGLGLWASLLLKSAFALIGVGAYLHIIVELPLRPAALTLLTVVVVLNVLGVRKVGKVQIWVVAVALVGLIALAIWGSLTFHQEYLGDEFSDGAGGLLAAVAFVYISYAGVTKVAAVAEEVANPDRNLPLGILLSLLVVTAIYVAVTLVLVANVPVADLSSDLRPIHTLAAAVGGPVVGVVAAALGVLTLTSMANSGLLASSRFPFAMSRDDLLPGAISFVHSRYKTPVTSIVLTGAVMAAAIILLDVAKLAKLAGSFMILAFMAVNLTVVFLRESDAQWYKPSFRTPLYPWVQLVGILGGFALLWMMGGLAVVAFLALGIPGLLLFLLYGRRRTKRMGLYGRLGPRQELLAEVQSLAGDLRDALPGEAAVVVALVGPERSPEALVEMGGALSNGKKTEVLHLTDVPEQTVLDAVGEGVGIQSLRRRVNALSAERGFDIDFDAVVTHDVVKTVHEVTSRVHCQWLVMEWRGEESSGVSLFNPLGWLINNLTCNLVFLKDQGIRYVREILVLPRPGPHDALVARTADHLATTYGARLTFVRFVGDPASDVTKEAAAGYLRELGRLCESEPETLLLSGEDEVQAVASVTPAYDLLLMGDRADRSLRDKIFGTDVEKLTKLAACSVMRLKTPRKHLHESFDRDRARTSEPGFDLLSYLDEDLAAARLEVNGKAELFAWLAREFSDRVGVPAQDIEEALWERERTQNTAVGHGVGLPHATVADVDRTYLGIFTAAVPIDYDVPEGERVDVIFATLGPPTARNTHLLLLSGIARLVQLTALLPRLRDAQDAAGLLAAFQATGQGDGDGDPQASVPAA